MVKMLPWNTKHKTLQSLADIDKSENACWTQAYIYHDHWEMSFKEL